MKLYGEVHNNCEAPTQKIQKIRRRTLKMRHLAKIGVLIVDVCHILRTLNLGASTLAALMELSLGMLRNGTRALLLSNCLQSLRKCHQVFRYRNLMLHRACWSKLSSACFLLLKKLLAGADRWTTSWPLAHQHGLDLACIWCWSSIINSTHS